MRPSRYWQHTAPLTCPKGHTMGWLGSVYWLCTKCPQQGADGTIHRGRRGVIWVQTPLRPGETGSE